MVQEINGIVVIAGLTVGELRRQLESYPDDQPVVMSSDAEGNNHSPVAEVTDEAYVPESTWSGEIVHPEDQDGTETAVVCLWPVN